MPEFISSKYYKDNKSRNGQHKTSAGCQCCESIDECQNYIEKNIIDVETFESLTYPFKLNFNYYEINKYLYNATKTVFLILNMILSYETIKLIKQPFSHSKNKVNIFYFLSVILLVTGIIGYILCFILDKGHLVKTTVEPVKFHKLWAILGVICFCLIIISFLI